jgi:hypothetical protein
MYRLLEPLRLLGLESDPTITDDLDTRADAARWAHRQQEHS